ncbi:MAG: cytochrome P450, partial [Sulfurovum sp.]|nr:cytochrome P450 [Sulfurovum sp.]
MKKIPFYPKTTTSKVSLLYTFFVKKRSWLDGIYEKSYAMKMGRIKMPGLDMNIVNQTPLIKRVMVDEVREFPKHKQLGDFLKPLLGESSFTTNGEQWRKQRNMLNPSFENAKISKVFGLMKDSADDLMKHLRENEDKKVVEVDAEMTYVTADIIFRTIMSTKLERDEAEK